jgi:hypothetical protein
VIEIKLETKWTPAVKDMLELLLGQEPPLSYRMVAAELTKQFGVVYTKNACIGMGRRLRMPPRPSPIKKKRDGRFLVPKHVRVDAPIVPKEAWRPEESQALTIYQLGVGDCKWPLGEMMTRPPFLYCGKIAADGLPYCKKHCEIAYNKPRGG